MFHFVVVMLFSDPGLYVKIRETKTGKKARHCPSKAVSSISLHSPIPPFANMILKQPSAYMYPSGYVLSLCDAGRLKALDLAIVPAVVLGVHCRRHVERMSSREKARGDITIK